MHTISDWRLIQNSIYKIKKIWAIEMMPNKRNTAIKLYTFTTSNYIISRFILLT